MPRKMQKTAGKVMTIPRKNFHLLDAITTCRKLIFLVNLFFLIDILHEAAHSTIMYYSIEFSMSQSKILYSAQHCCLLLSNKCFTLSLLFSKDLRIGTYLVVQVIEYNYQIEKKVLLYPSFFLEVHSISNCPNFLCISLNHFL